MSDCPQAITASEAYTVAEFRRRMGIGDYAFRELRRSGLLVRCVGKKRFVLGADWLQYLSQADAEETALQPQ